MVTLGPGSSLTQTVCARPLGRAGRKRVMAAIRQLGISAPMASRHQLRDHRRRCQWESLSRTLVDSGWRARTRIIRASHAKRGVWRGRRCGMVRLAATEAGHLRSKRRQTSRGVVVNVSNLLAACCVTREMMRWWWSDCAAEAQTAEIHINCLARGWRCR